MVMGCRYLHHGISASSCLHRFMRFGRVGEAVMDDVKIDAMREYGYLGWCRNHWDKVTIFAQNFLNKS
jgi:hypothetical protein